jgi:hypothetical protein
MQLIDAEKERRFPQRIADVTRANLCMNCIAISFRLKGIVFSMQE